MIISSTRWVQRERVPEGKNVRGRESAEEKGEREREREVVYLPVVLQFLRL